MHYWGMVAMNTLNGFVKSEVSSAFGTDVKPVLVVAISSNML